MKNIKTIVLYIDDSSMGNNRIFDMKAVGSNRYLWGWVHLHDECAKKGISLITSDVYFAMPERPPALLIYHSIQMKPLKALLEEKNLRPAIFTVYEGPLYGCFLYWNLGSFTSHFDHVFLPDAAHARVSKKAEFHPHVDPLPYEQTEVPGGFASRKYLMLINRNTRMNPWKMRFAKAAQAIRPFPNFDPRELYIDRLNVIKYFAEHNTGFDLYGHLWEKPIPYASKEMEAEYRPAITRTYRGEVNDKMTLLRGYRFSICFENTIFGGYVTEKIFDSMFSGCIPIYWGAPNVTEYVPANTFIDFRNFKSYEELDRYLTNMTEKTYNEYIRNINAFLHSEQYARFSSEQFSRTMLSLFDILIAQ